MVGVEIEAVTMKPVACSRISFWTYLGDAKDSRMEAYRSTFHWGRIMEQREPGVATENSQPMNWVDFCQLESLSAAVGEPRSDRTLVAIRSRRVQRDLSVASRKSSMYAGMKAGTAWAGQMGDLVLMKLLTLG